MRLFIFLISFAYVLSAFGQLQSPEQFLGYTVGTKATPHWKIIDYFKHVEEHAPTRVKMQQYGESVEGRPLYITYISSESHIQHLEEVRLNNLRLTQTLLDTTANEQAPAIVWISNNAHGNEISSAEAAMLTLFELVNPQNDKTKEWLEKVLVVIDPCLNPDGTERYVNWFNSVVGVNYNPSLFARERNEPWPTGRVNHYYFDLNRDWAWQTQIESRHRAVLYNSWLPHIHVDFHEMNLHMPYYFPPAAEPLHEVITPWQRSFQTTIGKHNAQYFDQQGWLYFTKESFDLFYPSYGDTYPTYSGAIGMTYEQAGNSAAGIGVLTNERDTLTLVDRVKHQHASGLNAIDIVAQNAEQVVKEFKKFFDDANSGRLSSYRAYIIKYTDRNHGKFLALQDLLDKNDIRYFSGSGTTKGYDYASKQEKSYTYTEKDLIIPGSQPKAALVRVLFEPEAKLVDSVTYDITAWSLPYVYGLDAIASNTAITATNPYTLEKISNTLENGFGFAFKWENFHSAQLMADLMKNKFNVRISEEPFSYNGVDFPRGSGIVLTHANAKVTDFKTTLSHIADKHQVKIYTISSGIADKGNDLGSSKVRAVKPPQVVVLSGSSTRALNLGEVWHYFDHQLQYPLTLVDTETYSRINWKEVDVLILSGGTYSFLKDKAQADKLGEWVRAGGKVIALQTAVDQVREVSWAKLEAAKKDSTVQAQSKELPAYADRTRTSITNRINGAIFKVKVDSTHPLMYGYDTYYTLKQNDKLYPYFTENQGWNTGYLQPDALMSGFVGSRSHKKIENGLLFGVENVGRGSVVYLTDNILFRNFWENGKLMMANAVFQVGN